MLETLQLMQLMIIYERNMLINDKLILPLLHRNNHVQYTKHGDTKKGPTTWTLMGGEQCMANVTSQGQNGQTYLVKLVEAKYKGWE